MKTIPLTQGKVAIIDDGDFELVSKYKWYALKSRNFWYAVTNHKGRFLYMHRLIIGSPKGYETDHKDRNSLDNRRHNLRTCTTSQNQYNSYPGKPNKKSRYKGLQYDKTTGKWRVRIRQNGKQLYVCGSYVDEKEAAKAYDKKAKEAYGEFAYLNFP